MKYIKPPDFKSVKDLQAYYKKVEDDITRLLTTDASARTADELNAKLSQALQAATAFLAEKNKDFSKKELSTAFEEGKGELSQAPKVSASEAAAILEKQGFRYAKNAFSTPLYIELQTATQAAGKGLKSRVNNIIKDLRKDGKDSVYNVRQAIIKDLTDKAIFEVVYSNGAKQPLHAYAAMAARSARIESMNIGAIGRALQMGTDYVKMTTVGQCCALCGAYQGKVYCISGKDKRFPALFKTVLKRGYALPHPNCRHEFVAWFIDMEDPADVDKAIRDSKIRYDKNGNLVDVRWQKDIESYAQWQAGNRQLNNELLEYNRMRKELGKDAPYKTLGAFRRARRAEELSPAFKKWRYKNRDKKQYEHWKTIVGEENMPKTVDEFQEIKYNKNKQATYGLLRHYKWAVDKGEIAAISGFLNYKNQYSKINTMLLGKKFNGVEIKKVSYHFIDRTVGSIYYTYTRNGKPIKHEGVPVESSLDILSNGKARPIVSDAKRRLSQKFILKGVGDVTINPETGELVQANRDE